MNPYSFFKLLLPGFFVLLPGTLFAAAVPQRIESQSFGFGTSVQTDGEIIVVGAPGAQVNGNPRQGEAFVFEWQEERWVRTGRVRSMDGDAEDRFGEVVAVDEGTVLVGAPNAAVDGLVEAGAVYAFMRDAEGEWTQTGRITAADPTTMAAFGSHIAIDGTRIVVAAPGADVELGESSGAAYVYDRTGSGWQQDAKLKEDVATQFATSVDVSGDRVALTAAEGSAYVYERANGSWTLTETLQPVASGARTVFVKLEDDVLVIAAPGEDLPDVPVFMAGVVHVFEPVDDGWREVVALESPIPGRHQEYFGLYTDLNDGLLAAANGFEFEDHVSLYMFDENGEWTLVHELDGPLHIEQSLAVSARALVIGSPDQGEGFNGFIEIFQMADLLPAVADDTGDDTNDDNEPDPTTGGDDTDPYDNADDMADDSGDNDEGEGEGEGDNSDGETAGGNTPNNPPASGGSSGGGATGILLALLLALKGVQRRTGHSFCQAKDAAVTSSDPVIYRRLCGSRRR